LQTVILVLSLCFQPALGVAAELRWKLREGDELVGKIYQHSEVVTTISATTTNMSLNTGMEFTWRVTSVDNGSMQIEQRFTRLTLKLEMPKTDAITYDSASQAKPSNDAQAIADAVQPLLAAPLSFRLSPRGEISQVQLPTDAKKTLDDLKSKPLKSLLTEEGLAQIFSQALVVLPEGSVEPGGTWEATRTLPTPLGSAQQTTTYKLLPADEKSPGVARIESTSQLAFDAKSKSKTTLKSHDQGGTLLFDTGACQLRSAKTTQELVTTTALKDTPIQVKLTSELSFTLDAK
jgi:hypothetical protein